MLKLHITTVKPIFMYRKNSLTFNVDISVQISDDDNNSQNHI